MRYFLDTEFIEDGHTIDLISIGIVAEDGRTYYAEVLHEEVPWHRANDWVLANVKPHLSGHRHSVRTKRQIADDVVAFVGRDRPEFWGYYADYDWVVLCQLYGRMIDLPEGWPMFCMDLKQLAVAKGDPRLPTQTSTEHHALADARWNRDIYNWLAAAGSVTPTGDRCRSMEDGTPLKCDFRAGHDGPHSFDPQPLCGTCGQPLENGKCFRYHPEAPAGSATPTGDDE